MITKITHLTLFVNNQDEALNFYTENLGFRVHTDAMFGPMRWLTLHPFEQPHFELSIMLAENDAEKALVGKQGAEKPLFCIESTDCKKDYARLKANGVTVIGEPEEQPWGISISLKDPAGNIIYMVQPTALTGGCC